ncbi:MAG: hypothetical protein M3Z66_02365 [Chloroflexota bacterium]|nr:hypothetical protein [Chloroflexota bacterium]
MSIHQRTPRKWPRHVLALCRTWILAALEWLTCHRPRDHAVPVEVLISGPWRRWLVARRLRTSVRRLQHILPLPPTLDVAVVVQTAIMAERQLPGCYQISQHPDGSRFALIRLALQVDYRHLTTDEILAVLAEQYIALTMHADGPSVLVPIDLGAAGHRDPVHGIRLPCDPLVARNEFGDRIA